MDGLDDFGVLHAAIFRDDGFNHHQALDARVLGHGGVNRPDVGGEELRLLDVATDANRRLRWRRGGRSNAADDTAGGRAESTDAANGCGQLLWHGWRLRFDFFGRFD